MPDLYAVLGVDRDADERSIRDAYRRLARVHHPDAGGEQDRMMILNKAWHVLGDPQRRAAYDAKRSRPKAARPPEMRNGHQVLDFGRYQGWTIPEIANMDDDYLHWLQRTSLGRPLRSEIARVLDEREAAMATIRTAARASAAASATRTPKRSRWRIR